MHESVTVGCVEGCPEPRSRCRSFTQTSTHAVVRDNSRVVDGGNALAPQASPETVAHHMLPIEVRINTLQSMQADGLGGSESTTMHVKHESKNVLQVQNRTVCFMLATEAPSDPLARMRLPGDRWPELLHLCTSLLLHVPPSIT